VFFFFFLQCENFLFENKIEFKLIVKYSYVVMNAIIERNRLFKTYSMN